MDKSRLVLAALAASNGDSHSPVQVQKLLFLIDKEIPEYTEGPHFNFLPYDYGPFDKDVYRTLDLLAFVGLVETEESGRGWKRYRLTPDGQQHGEKVLADLPANARQYVEDASKFVRSLSFADLVSAIYQAYPEMKVNSVFGK